MQGVFSATLARLLPLQLGFEKVLFAKLKVSH